VEGGDDNMELELMNLFHLYIGDKVIGIRANITKKQLAEELKEFSKDNEEFRYLKFKMLMHKKGYKFYYE
jgi:hypothetical protein